MNKNIKEKLSFVIILLKFRNIVFLFDLMYYLS